MKERVKMKNVCCLHAVSCELYHGDADSERGRR